MKNLVNRFFREQQGQDLIEYALLAGLISIAAVASIELLGLALNTKYVGIEAGVTSAS